MRSMGAWRRWIGWQGGKGRTLGLLLLLEAAALVAFAEWAAPQAQERLREAALRAVEGGLRDDAGILAFAGALFMLGPLAAGEALAEWADWAGPLLRPLPFLLGCLACVALCQGVDLALRWGSDPPSLRELVLGLPPLPPTRRARQAMVAVGAVGVIWLLACRWFLAGFTARALMDLVVGNTVWQARSALDAASLTVTWTGLFLLGLPIALFVALNILSPFPMLLLVFPWMAVICVARRRWWQKRLASGETVLLTPERAEWWTRRRRWTPRFLLAWIYGGSQAVEALDRAAAEALAREVRA